jgi:uncharacterized protein (TIGR03000 family)
MLTIVVPEGARVTINDRPTNSTGRVRQYVSHGLKPGRTYKYEVKAIVYRDGQPVESVRSVYLSAGATEHLAIDIPQETETQLASHP